MELTNSPEPSMFIQTERLHPLDEKGVGCARGPATDRTPNAGEVSASVAAATRTDMRESLAHLMACLVSLGTRRSRRSSFRAWITHSFVTSRTHVCTNVRPGSKEGGFGNQAAPCAPNVPALAGLAQPRRRGSASRLP